MGKNITKNLSAAIIVTLLMSCGLADRADDFLNEDYDQEWVPDARAVSDLHSSLFIVDLHADTMLWDRDLLEESDSGHVDLPRLIEGNVALQVFAVVTHAPLKGAAPDPALLTNSEATECISAENLNPTGPLHAVQLRPIEVWFDQRERALYQIRRLKRFIDESRERNLADPSQPYLMLIETAEDLEDLIEVRRQDLRQRRPPRAVGAMLAVEGAHWLGGDGMGVEAGVEELFVAGVRMVAPTHRFDNALGASSEGCNQLAGLTEAGRHFLQMAEARGMVLDLAHASDLGIREGTEGRGGPVVVSHTGVRSLCQQEHSDDDCVWERNMASSEIEAVARTGGAIGIGYWPAAAGRGVGDVARAFAAAYATLDDPAVVARMRAIDPDYDPLEHIALGSDFDGSVSVPFDTGDLAQLTAALTSVPIPCGLPPSWGPVPTECTEPPFDAEALRLIFGANACRIFALRLPDGGPEAAERICAPLRSGGGYGADAAG